MKSKFISTKTRAAAHLDWATPVKSYLKAIYGSSLDLSSQVKQFARLRDCVNQDDSNLENLKNAYYKYYGQLELLDLRLPIGEGVHVKFKWFDSYNPEESHSQHSLAFEKASVLFNLGSILSRLGEDYFTEGDYKLAYQHFQCAAGVYKFVSENFLRAPSEDLSGKTMSFLLHLELGQAQEVMLLKILKEGSGTDALISKIAEACALHYTAGLEKYETIDGDFGDDFWITLLRFKKKFYKGLAYYYNALAIEEKKVGESIASLKAAIEDWTLLKAIKNVPDIDFKSYISLAEDKLRTLSKENDLIYHDSIPPRDAVEIKPLEAAKALSLNEQKIENVIGEDIFEKVIPMDVHEKLSYYSEEKAKMLRNQIEMNQTSDTELSSFLEYLKLPGSLAQFKDSLNNKLDERLLTWSQKVSSSQHSDLSRNKTLIQSKRDNILNTIKKLETMLQEEEQDYNANSYKIGTQQDSSASSNASLRDELTNAKQSLVSASTLDEQIQQTLQGDVKNLEILKSRSALEAEFFGNNTENLLDFSDSGSTETTKQSIAKIESNLRILNSMKSERNKVIEDLKKNVHEDDISSILVLNNKKLSDKDEKELFAEELKKFDSFVNRLDELSYKQTQIIKSVKKEYQSLLTSNSNVKDQQQKITSFETAFTHFQDYEVNLSKGLSFYDNLQNFVNQVESNVRSFVQNRKSQRQRLLSQSEATDPLTQRFEALRMNSTASAQSPLSQQPSLYQQNSQQSFNPQYPNTPSQSYAAPPQQNQPQSYYNYTPPTAPTPSSTYSQPLAPTYARPQQPQPPQQPPQQPIPQQRSSYSSSASGSISGAPPLPPKEDTTQNFYAQKSAYDASLYQSFTPPQQQQQPNYQSYTQPYDPSKFQ